MKTACAILIALVMTGVYAPAARADEEAQKFLTGIYQRYVGQNTPGIVLDSNEALLSYFTPELAAMIALDAERSAQNDEPPALDGDPFIGAQDWDIKNVLVTVKDTGPATAVGTATFTNMGEPQTVELALKKTSQGWRIDDIQWSDSSLRGILNNVDDDEKKELPGTEKL